VGGEEVGTIQRKGDQRIESFVKIHGGLVGGEL
jgi:hypothetical protein